MSGYEDIISKLKKKLENFGSVESEIAKLYETAKNERTKEYEKARAEIAQKRDDAIRAASINKKKSEKDLSQFHEARGLTSSGEAINEALNRELIEAGAIREAKAEHSKNEDALKDSYESDINTLKQNELKNVLDEKEKLEDEILELEKMQLKANNGSSNSGSNSNNGTGAIEGSGDYEPTISESVLATRLFNMFKGSDGELTAGGKRELELYLEKLREENNLSDEYMKNLIFALKSYGYDKVSDDEELDGTFDSLERAANASEAKVEDLMYRFYRGRGASESEAMTEAKKHAIWAKLDVIYKNSVSREQFIYYARKMGSSMSTIYRYFDRVEDVNKYNIDGGIYLKKK